MELSSLKGQDASIELVPFVCLVHDSKAPSLFDTSSSAGMNPTGEVGFKPSSSLQIQAAGKAAFSFPAPAKQLEVPIFSPTTGRPVYLSIRPRRCKGDCRLVKVDADGPEEVAGGGDHPEAVGCWPTIARTTYRFGPGRNPVVRIGRDDNDNDDGGNDGGNDGGGGIEELEMVGRGMLTRAVGFDTARWGSFEWRYGNRRERAQWAADNLLVLERVQGGTGERVRVAQLVRNDGFRTPGTKNMTAGNGGRLQMDLVDKGGLEIIDEVVVVVTCLVMLKKEIDRLRAMQIAAMSAVAGAS